MLDYPTRVFNSVSDEKMNPQQRLRWISLDLLKLCWAADKTDMFLVVYEISGKATSRAEMVKQLKMVMLSSQWCCHCSVCCHQTKWQLGYQVRQQHCLTSALRCPSAAETEKASLVQLKQECFHSQLPLKHFILFSLISRAALTSILLHWRKNNFAGRKKSRDLDAQLKCFFAVWLNLMRFCPGHVLIRPQNTQ